MRRVLAGHLLQLMGYALVFLGLGLTAGAMVLAGSYPTVPFWVFVVAAVGVAAPVMVAGGRVNAAGRGRVLGVSSADAAREYHLGTRLLGVYLAVLLAQGFWAAAPLALCALGTARPSDPVVVAWVTTWMLVFCAGRDWITRPVVCAAERRLAASSAEVRHPAGRALVHPAPERRVVGACVVAPAGRLDGEGHDLPTTGRPP